MILGEKVLREMYPDLDDNQYQPNSIDLKLGKVEEAHYDGSMVGIVNGAKLLPQTTENIGDIRGRFKLEPMKSYWVIIDNEIIIPDNVCQLYYPRSTLLRMGLSLHTAVGDSGFKGHLKFLLVNNTHNPIYIDKGERIATAVNFIVDGGTKYDGDYQE